MYVYIYIYSDWLDMIQSRLATMATIAGEPPQGFPVLRKPRTETAGSLQEQDGWSLGSSQSLIARQDGTSYSLEYIWMSLYIIGISWIIGYYWILLYIVGYHWISLDIIEYYWILFDIIEYHGIWLEYMDHSSVLDELLMRIVHWILSEYMGRKLWHHPVDVLTFEVQLSFVLATWNDWVTDHDCIQIASPSSYLTPIFHLLHLIMIIMMSLILMPYDLD